MNIKQLQALLENIDDELQFMKVTFINVEYSEGNKLEVGLWDTEKETDVIVRI